MATTTKGVPYPVGADNNNAPTWFQSLAQWVDDNVSGGRTQAEINAFTAGEKWVGRIVFNTTTKVMQYWDGVRWKIMGPPVGSIMWCSGPSTDVVEGALRADGTAYSRTTYADLFARIGTTHGAGDGSTTFNVPNLKGRVMCGFDSAQTEFDAVGETGGAKTFTLTTAQLPAHTHTGPSHTHTTSDHQHSGPNHNHDMTHGHTSPGTNVDTGHTHDLVDGVFQAYVQQGAGGALGVQLVAATAAGGFISATGNGGSHGHTVAINNFSGGTGFAGTGLTGAAGAGNTGAAGTGNTGSTGTGTAFSILNPYLVLVPYVVV